MAALVLVSIERQENGLLKVEYQSGENDRAACQHELDTANEIINAIKVFICERNMAKREVIHAH
ncbi:hypothetical protein ABQ345_18415 [Serratia fonticola]|uniref:hypothetical protein n=1 Tax=Serratia fonticola TaxID=47917 RepID=UPI003AACC0D9